MNKITKLQNGITLQIINDKKFKTAAISVNFINKLSKETATINALLPYVLKRGCEKIPETLELNRYLDELYASKISCNVSKSGDNQIISLTGITVSDIYAKNDAPFSKLIQLIYDIIYNPYLPDGKFDSLYIEREKENMKLFIESIKNDKREYARKRVIEEMFENSPYSLYAYGDVESLSKITSEELYSFYETNFKNSIVNIVVAGAVNETAVLTQLSELFGNRNSNIEMNQIKTSAIRNEVKTVTEPTDVTQSKLAIGYKTEITRNHPLYFGMLLFDNLFGGSVHSKLFLNVREKLSLAYYASSRYNSYKGFLVVDSGIETKNYEKAKNEINKQLDEMKKGNFTDKDIEFTKLALTNNYKSAKDSLSSLLNYCSSTQLVEKFIEIDEAIEMINKTSREEIISAAQSVKPDTIYLLKGRD